MKTADPALSERLLRHFRTVRRRSEALARPLRDEDQVVQTMPDVSPTKWHLAHVTWFFEAFVLEPYAPEYRAHDPRFHYLFNSYYETVGRMHPRPERGLLSRPTVAEVMAYRAHVDEAVEELLGSDPPRGTAAGDDSARAEVLRRIELGLHHEEQHQELLLMDIKHVLGSNPLRPAYLAEPAVPAVSGDPAPAAWVRFAGGVHEVGADGDGFAFDNERPRHRALLEDFELQDRLVTCSDWAEFVDDGGYRRPELWMADGWAWVRDQRIEGPLYWERGQDGWYEYAMRGGLAPLEGARPVVHVSWFEADAFARWAGARLPSEAEWEVAAGDRDPAAGALDLARLEPSPAHPEEPAPRQLFGEVWEWTASAYLGYPGFAPLEGSLGEYNGKFMCGQFVLRGGSCATPPGHARATYRNFFYPHQRWAFAGLRLART